MDFYTYMAKLDDKRGINSVYDGDTISKLQVNLGFNIKHINSLRIIGIDTPELRTKNKIEKIKGYQARDMLRLLIGDNQIAIKSISKKGTGKYGRLLGELYIHTGVNLDKEGRIINHNWINAGNKLVECGLAVVYDGGTKTKDWSEDHEGIEAMDNMINKIKEGNNENI
jgi:micrococcal nuclease